jgi:hypothetical protein
LLSRSGGLLECIDGHAGVGDGEDLLEVRDRELGDRRASTSAVIRMIRI